MSKGVRATNIQLQQLAKRISYFRDIFMRITLPTEEVYRNESNIVNLDNTDGPDTHWVARSREIVLYFDSFDNLQLPKELTRYLNIT